MPVTVLLLPWLIAGCILAQRTPPAQAQGPDDSARQAAEITLLTLRSTVNGAINAERYYVLPTRVPLSHRQAARLLVKKGKPVACTGSMEGTVLAIECRSMTEREDLDWQRDAAKHGTSIFEEEGGQRCRQPMSNARLLMHRRGDSLNVTFGALAEWFRDYKVAASLGVEAPRSLPPGVCMVIGIDPPARIRVEQSRTPPRAKT